MEKRQDRSVRRRRFQAFATITAGGIVALTIAATVGAHGGDLAVIHACVTDVGTATGQVRITSHPLTEGRRRFGDPNALCSRAEHPLDWGIRGPAGPPGPAGAQGPQGPPGSTGGAPQVSRVTVVSKDKPASSKAVTVLCPSGARAIGGGFEIGGGAINAKTVTRSFPVGDPPNAWKVKAFDAAAGTNSWRLRAWAVCMETSK